MIEIQNAIKNGKDVDVTGIKFFTAHEYL